MKRLLILVSLLIAFVVASCRIKEKDARDLAVARFRKVCTDFKLDRNAYSGPVVTKVKGFPYEFEWRKKDNDSDGVLIMVDSHGAMNVSFLDRKSGADRPSPAPTKSQ